MWGIKLGLENISDFCRHLGDPQSQFLSIHVAGTNGKGSTCAFLDAILRAAGYRVGRYTSPHLRDFRERIQVGGRPIARDTVAEFVQRHWSRIRKERYTFFETTTALAFDAFARARVEIGVVEVGLGGRFDATNVIAPQLSIITRIARDHEQILGRTPERIAFEKAGIIKSGVPVLTGNLLPAADRVIRRVADQRGAPLWSASEILDSVDAAPFLPGPSERWPLPLPGEHQIANLAIALAALAILDSQGIRVGRSANRRGIAGTIWPGRFQIVAGHPTVVYDAAHNPDGVGALANTWRTVFGRRRPVCVWTARLDKDYRAMAGVLSGFTSHWIGSPLPGGAGIGPQEQKDAALDAGCDFTWAGSPRAALSIARRMAGPSGAVLVTGSHHLLGALMPQALLGQAGRTPPRAHVSRRDILLAAAQRGVKF